MALLRSPVEGVDAVFGGDGVAEHRGCEAAGEGAAGAEEEGCCPGV